MATRAIQLLQHEIRLRPRQIKYQQREERREGRTFDDFISHIEKVIERVTTRNTAGRRSDKTELIYFDNGTVAVARVDFSGEVIEKSQAYDPAHLRKYYFCDPETAERYIANPSLIDYEPTHGILRPTEFTEGKLGYKPLGTREYQVLQEEGRLFDVLRITSENMGGCYPSIAMESAIELCKMDGGLNGPNRNGILFLGWQIIQLGALDNFLGVNTGREVIACMAEEKVLVKALDKCLESMSESHREYVSNTFRNTLLTALIIEGEGINDSNRDRVKSLYQELVDRGCYELIDEEVLELLQEGGNEVLERLQKLYFDDPTNTNNRHNFLSELERQIRQIEVQKTHENPDIAEALYEIKIGCYHNLDDTRKDLLQANGNIGLAELKKQYEEDEYKGSYYAQELLRQGKREEALGVYIRVPRGYRGPIKALEELTRETFENKDYYLKKVKHSENDKLKQAETKLKNKEYSLLLHEIGSTGLELLRANGNIAVNYLNDKLKVKEDEEYHKLALLYELIRQGKDEEAKSIIQTTCE